MKNWVVVRSGLNFYISILEQIFNVLFWSSNKRVKSGFTFLKMV